MRRLSGRKIAAAAGLLAAVSIAACSPAARMPDRGSAGPAAGADAGPAPGERSYTGADVRFMQGMIAHHAQALAMTALAPARSRREDVRLLAERIEVSQEDEIAAMRRWLEKRGEAVPGPDAHHGHHGSGGHALMPGMLTPEELARLAAVTGSAFDRLFLESMIRHHEGALVMVRELFASRGAGQEPEIFQFATEVDADQRVEIARMRAMLDALPSGAGRR
ncbi:MAG TPA: DUF305 domain-containing protein [Longimicrobiaceae bacterium]|nr:DUF305 domain-containing protein [Longimicrobiaceae bacterium]